MHIRCSGLARTMACSGFKFLQFEESQGGDAAKEGTAAGEYLEYRLLNKPLSSHASNGIYFDEDMKFYTAPIEKDVKSRASDGVRCEQRIDWTTRSGIVIKGQYDIAFIDHNDVLCIEDLKYGYGLVEVKENWQLLGYAIGEAIRLNRHFKHISLKIHQPRAHHEDGSTREWLMTWDELLHYKEIIEKKMDDIVAGDRTLTTSPSCKYCPAAGEACGAFNRLYHNALDVTTDFIQDSLTEQELSTQLDQVKRAEEAIKIKKDSLIELGINRIKEGKLIPNYIQVAKRSNRSWNNNVGPEAILAMTGIDITERNVMTPAKAEKAGVSKELVKSLSGTRPTGFKLEKKNTSEVGNAIFGTNAPVMS